MEATATQPRPLVALDRNETFRISDNGTAWIIEERKDNDEHCPSLGRMMPRRKAKPGLAANSRNSEYKADQFASNSSVVWLTKPFLSSKLFKTCIVRHGLNPRDEMFEWTDKTSLIQAIATTRVLVDRHGRKSLTAFWDSYDDYRKACEVFGMEAVLMHLERRILYAEPMDETLLQMKPDEDFVEVQDTIHPAYLDLLQNGDSQVRAWIQEILAIERK